MNAAVYDTQYGPRVGSQAYRNGALTFVSDANAASTFGAGNSVHAHASFVLELGGGTRFEMVAGQTTQLSASIIAKLVAAGMPITVI